LASTKDSTLQRDPSPAFPTAGTSHEPYTRQQEDTHEASDPVTPLQTSPANPSFPAGDLFNIISQLCSVKTDPNSEAQQLTVASSSSSNAIAGHPLFATLTSLLTTLTNKGPDPDVLNDPTSSKEEYQEAICKILDQQNVLDDGTDIDGYYDVSNPFVFAAGTQNNPDVLSRSCMLKADDRDEFLKTEHSEISDLHDAGVFEYMPVSNIPSERRRKLLNSIWSYHRKP
jgi:hypothetical protein